MCVSEARPKITSRSGVPQPAVSLQLQSDHTATQSAELQKHFFPLLLAASVHPSSSSASLSFMVTVGMGINICGNIFLSILGFRGEAELDLSNFKQL